MSFIVSYSRFLRLSEAYVKPNKMVQCKEYFAQRTATKIRIRYNFVDYASIVLYHLITH